jgi:hypothetical protein
MLYLEYIMQVLEKIHFLQFIVVLEIHFILEMMLQEHIIIQWYLPLAIDSDWR